MQSILVTGAGGGLGAHVSGLLASSGGTVYAADSDRRSLRPLSAHTGIIALSMDVTRAGEVARVRKKIESMTDGLDGVVCCAGIFAGGPLVEADEHDMSRILDVNVMGAFRVVKEFFPLLRKRKGIVVLVGSESSRCPMPFNGPYTVSKSALQAYADVLRRELMFIGVRVTIVHPGGFRTPLLSGARSMMDRKRYGTLFSAELSVVTRLLSREFEKAMDPAKVARVVVRALCAHHPRPCYRVGNDPLRALLGKLPASWTDRLIRWFTSRRSSPG
jgi:NAD(P)-dependent dehydrogenase (short-subunit alcohol dehydrogenase family)